jgi:hypothetical protein
MLPPVSAINYVEMIRDGGSLEASFVGPNGSKYCLHFPLFVQVDSEGLRKRSGYMQPVVFERLEFRHEDSFEWQSANEVEISWQHAQVLLQQFRKHPLNTQQEKWLKAMEDVAKAEGDLVVT